MASHLPSEATTAFTAQVATNTFQTALASRHLSNAEIKSIIVNTLTDSKYSDLIDFSSIGRQLFSSLIMSNQKKQQTVSVKSSLKSLTTPEEPTLVPPRTRKITRNPVMQEHPVRLAKDCNPALSLSRRQRKIQHSWMKDQIGKNQLYTCPRKLKECPTCVHIFKHHPLTVCHSSHKHGPLGYYPHCSAKDLRGYHEGKTPSVPQGIVNPLKPKDSVSLPESIHDDSTVMVPPAPPSVQGILGKRRREDDSASVCSVTSCGTVTGRPFPPTTILGMPLNDKMWSSVDTLAFEKKVERCLKLYQKFDVRGGLSPAQWSTLKANVPPHCSLVIWDFLTAKSQSNHLALR